MVGTSSAGRPEGGPGADGWESRLPLEPIRPVTDDEVERFWTDGVVLLRGILPIVWIDALAEPLELTITRGESVDLGAMAVSPGDAGQGAAVPAFTAGVDHWRTDATFADFSLRSPLGPIVAALLRSERVSLWEDSVLVKEPGSPFETRFHTDAAYFHATGEQICTVWVPLDAAAPDNGMIRWVTGSHLDPVDYRPNLFVTDEPLDGTGGSVVPDVLGTPELAERVVTFEVEPGDITVHHARTIHGAYANASATQRRRAISVRYAGDGTVFSPVPGGLAKAHHAGMRAGDPLDPQACPLAWPRD